MRPGLDGVMEGGYKIKELMARIIQDKRTQIDIVEMAMVLETQALDLYIRMARESVGNVRTFFFNMANEENEHLSYLTREFEQLLG